MEEPRPVDSAGVEPTLIRPGASSPSEPTLVAGVRSAPPSPGPAGRAFGRYVLLGELGHGGMGIVWRAWDTELSRVVALKQILAQGAGHGELVTRFAREARLAAKLRHPHVIAIHDVGVHEGQHYFTADYIAGRTLDSVFCEGPVPLRQAVAWVQAIAEALSYALKRNPAALDARYNRALLFLRRGEAELARGQDPSGSLEQAIADCGEVLALNPQHAEAFCTRGDAYLSLGGAEEARGEDPGARYQAARDRR